MFQKQAETHHHLALRIREGVLNYELALQEVPQGRCGGAVGLTERVSHKDLRDKAGYVSYTRQKKTIHIMTKCININVTNIINDIIT